MTNKVASSIPFNIHGEGAGVAQWLVTAGSPGGLEFENDWRRVPLSAEQGHAAKEVA